MAGSFDRSKAGKIWGDGMTPKVIWEIVKQAAQASGILKLPRHDLRRTCARLCRLAGGELEQIQFLLGHVSIQTTERLSRMQTEAMVRSAREARRRTVDLQCARGTDYPSFSIFVVSI